MDLDPVLLSRIQFAFVISFHILFPAFTIGLASFIAMLEARYLASGDDVYLRLSKFWTRIFAVSFGMGVVSGIVMSYQFGTNWSRFSDATANVLGPLLSYEVLTAFFLEATFLGILLFGRSRVGKKFFFFAALMVAIGTLTSAFWILAANSWMQTPVGYEIRDGPKDKVFAGTLNRSAPLVIKVTATGTQTLLAEIVRLMDVAGQSRARYVRLADRIARVYSPVVHLAALVTFLGWTFLVGAPWQQSLMVAVAVLIITCPCALGLAVPVVQVVASGRLLRRGVLLKSADGLERLAAIDTVLFDKTGTLSLGRLKLANTNGLSDDDLALAVSLAAVSRHPLCQALSRLRPKIAPLDGVAEHPGLGLVAMTPSGELRLGSRLWCGVTEAASDHDGPELWLRRADGSAVRFLFDDVLRSDAAETVAALKARGLAVELLSGDRAPVVAAAARAAGIEDWRASAGPADKIARLRELAAAGHKVLMVGDGLNDAPALASASVSMSPASGADVSQAAADYVFQSEQLGAICEAYDVARQSQRLVVQNITAAFAYNALAVPLAVLGFVTPLIAAIAMSTSSIVVTLNSLRLYRMGAEKRRKP